MKSIHLQIFHAPMNEDISESDQSLQFLPKFTWDNPRARENEKQVRFIIWDLQSESGDQVIRYVDILLGSQLESSLHSRLEVLIIEIYIKHQGKRQNPFEVSPPDR